MPIRDHYRNVPQTVRAQIVTVDTRTRQIEAQLKDIGIVPVVIWEVPVAFRWPVEGEYWTLHYRNGYWTLGSPMEGDSTLDGDDTPAPIEGLAPGEMKLHSDAIFDAQGRQIVAVDGATDGQTIRWDDTTDQWVASSPVSGDANYVHNQGTPSNSWHVVHNLGKKPSVMIVDSAESVVFGDMTYIDNDSLTVTFSATFAGKAYLN